MAALGLEELSPDYPESLVIISWHNGDEFEFPEGMVRDGYYGITGYPTVWFDGWTPVVGGYTPSSYPYYVPVMEERVPWPSNFEVIMDIYETDGTLNVESTVEIKNGNSTDNLAVFVVLTETALESPGNEIQNWVARNVYPDGMGMPIDLSVETSYSWSTDVDILENYVIENCEIAVFIQNMDTKEIYQATSKMATDLSVAAGECENFDALIVGELVSEQLGGMWTTWSGTSADDATVSDMYSSSPDNSFVVDAGSVDLVRKFDDVAIETGQWLYSNYIYVPTGFSGYFNVQGDPAPGVEWVLDLFFDDGGTGSFGTSATSTFTYEQDTWIMVEINFDLDADFAEVYFDGALMTVFEWAGTIGGIDYYGYDVGGTPGAYYDDVCFEEGWVYTGIEEQLISTLQLYPNPASDVVNIKSESTMELVTVYNFAGQAVITETVNTTEYLVNTTELDAGVYLFQIDTEEGRISSRVIIK